MNGDDDDDDDDDDLCLGAPQESCYIALMVMNDETLYVRLPCNICLQSEFQCYLCMTNKTQRSVSSKQ